MQSTWPGELENTVFLIAPVQSSLVRIVILFIQFSNTVQNTSYFVMYMFFQSTDFVGFLEILLIVWSCAICGQFCKIVKFQMACQRFNTQNTI